MTQSPKFTELYFGMADSKNEARDNPEAFIESFVDPQGVVDDLRNRRKFLVLGPKGAGKSAVAWYMDLTASPESELISARDISELPIADVERMKTGDSAGVGRTVTAWKLIILCALLDIALKDQSSPLHQIAEVQRVEKELRKQGFMDPTPIKAVLETTKSTYKIPIPKVGEVFAREKTSSVHLANIVPFVEKWVAESRGSNQYTLILDGIDSIYLNDPQYFTSVSAMVQAVYSINQALRASQSSALIVLLVRNDLFSRLTLADAGKMREDFGADLDWRILSGQPRQAPLFKLVNEKAGSLVDNAPADIVSAYFPSDVQLGGRAGGAPEWMNIHKYLLNLTRHTPRDILRLFEHIRRVAAAGNLRMARDGKVTQEIIREGVLQYSSKYFVDAINNELVGREGDDYALVREGMVTLRHLHKSTFTLAEFTTECFGDSSIESRKSAEKILTWLFFAGALGNVRGGAENYLQFYHRREDTDVYLKGKLILHNALVHAWNIPR
ncbi:P-loop ATPase, Sll1717 family [Streptomyces umbrinus]|uniref:P-loop ATPase, Sll1717 family n=1 Tax=Streptomyces umbrinus TaxID=67370 RepID=UPI003C2C0F09